MTRIRAFWDYLRGTYWVVPSAMAVAAVALSVGMVRLDEFAASRLVDRWSWVFTGGPEGAREVLGTIASSMITIAGVTFSITIVALTLASQQFGPRLLRNFLRDPGSQIVLGTFISTFLYCLLVLRTVRGTDDTTFVPYLSVTLGVVLAMFSVGVLIYFIHHVSRSIQASQIITNVTADLEHAIERLFPEDLGEDEAAAESDARAETSMSGPGTASVCATVSGYVQAIDSERLLTLAVEEDLVLRVDAGPGAFVRTGSVLLTLRAPGQRSRKEDDRLRSAFIIGGERTGTQDVAFFLNQLVDLAVRALSPGVNDPGTARTCIDRLEQALCLVAGRRLPSARRYDAEGALRIVAAPVTLSTLAESALAEVGRHGGSSVSVSCRLLDAIGGIARCVRREEDRQTLMQHAETIASRARHLITETTDQDQIARCHRTALAALSTAPRSEP